MTYENNKNTTPEYQRLLANMESTYREHTGVVPADASDIGIRLKVLAGELHRLYQEMEQLNLQLFPQTSQGKYLDLHAELRGHQRTPASFAKGTVVFSRHQPAQVPTEIPKGTLVSTQEDTQQEYRTTEKAVIAPGETQVSVTVQANTAGPQGNLAAGKANLLVSSVPGISHANNPQPMTGGTAEETDDRLRQRLVHSYRNISNGSNAAYYYDMATAVSGVKRAVVIPRRRGRGTVDVAIEPENQAHGKAYALL